MAPLPHPTVKEGTMITTFDLANLLGVDAAAEHANLGAAIDSVRVVDANGLAPVDPGYTPTNTRAWR